MRLLSLSLAARDWLLHVRFLAARTGRRVLVDGYHFGLARPFLRGWMLPYSPKDEGEGGWQGKWLGGMCDVSWQQRRMVCRLTVFRCFQLSLSAELDGAERWFLSDQALLEVLTVPNWPTVHGETVGLLADVACPTGGTPLVVVTGGGWGLGVSQGAEAAGWVEGQQVPLCPLQLEAKLSTAVIGSPIAHLGSVLSDGQGGQVEFFPAHAGRRYHLMFPHEKGQLVYGEFDGLWNRAGGGTLRLSGSRGTIDTRVFVAH